MDNFLAFLAAWLQKVGPLTLAILAVFIITAFLGVGWEVHKIIRQAMVMKQCRKEGHVWEFGDFGDCTRGCGTGKFPPGEGGALD